MKIFYYYLRNDTHPYACICLIHDPKTMKFHRGTSICSKKDPFVKKTGRDKAMGRALEAMINEKSVGEIQGNRWNSPMGEYKSEYDVELNDIEREIVKDEI